MNGHTAPIALFVYKRPIHTRQTLEAIMANALSESSDLYIFSDGPKPGADAESMQRIEKVRSVVREKQWCRSVTFIESDVNKGLARSIISGVSELVEQFGKVIVIEDDLLTAPFFLQYMNSALRKYENHQNVMQVSGYMFPVRANLPTDALFLPLTTSWGWGVWRRSWDLFDENAGAYTELSNDPQKQYLFNLEGSYDYVQMLEMQLRGEIDSWAIRWYLSVFMNQGLVVYPKHSLVQNIGFDNSGEHCGESRFFDANAFDGRIESFPDEAISHAQTLNHVKYFLKHGAVC